MINQETRYASDQIDRYEGYTQEEWMEIDQVLAALPEAVDNHIERAAANPKYDLQPQDFDRHTVARGIINSLKRASDKEGDN